MCVCDWTSPGVIGNHLRLRSGQSCLERIAVLFEAYVADGGSPTLEAMNVVWKRG